MTSEPARPVEVFFSYSHKDEELRKELETHLAMLRNEGVIRGWHDRQIVPGQEWDGVIDRHLNSADTILLLASPDFFVSQYCYGVDGYRRLTAEALTRTLIEARHSKDARPRLPPPLRRLLPPLC
jgi:hypothetical protein